MYNSTGGRAIEFRRVHPNRSRLNIPGRERLNNSVERLFTRLLAQKLIMSLNDGPATLWIRASDADTRCPSTNLSKKIVPVEERGALVGNSTN